MWRSLHPGPHIADGIVLVFIGPFVAFLLPDVAPYFVALDSLRERPNYDP